jgi:hypothetical protein
MIDALRREQGLPVAPMCRVLDVSKSGSYAWKHRTPSARKQEEERIKVAIKAAHERGRGTYGPEKIQDERLDVEQMGVGLNRIKRLRRPMKKSWFIIGHIAPDRKLSQIFGRTSRCFTTGRDDMPAWVISLRRSTGRNMSCGKGLHDHNMVATIADLAQRTEH